jgi:uncharacterized cupredoxin-like copper-binding protein
MSTPIAQWASRPARLVALLLAAAAMGSACSSPAPGSVGVTVTVTLRDFRLSASTTRVAGGQVRFVLDNRGPSTHEFVIVRTERPARDLPILSDGLTVDEEASSLQAVDEDPDIALGATNTLDVRLAPGRYVLFCNLAGHYLGGMRLSLVVT